MIMWAHHKGHPISIFSTLTGLTPTNACRLIDIPIDKFVLHLPDAYGNAKIPQTQDYFEARSIIEMNVKHLEYMNMGWGFISNKCEDMARGRAELKKGRRLCNFLESPAYQLLPNGNVFFCCMVRGLTEKVGSLYENTYLELAARHGKISDRLQKDQNSICHYCNVSEKYWLRRAIQKKNELLKGKTIMQVLGV
ncbi:MAG: SPASM domain-containing protein [Patescibacteria group bacterium]